MLTLICCEGADVEDGKAPAPTVFWTGAAWTETRAEAREYETREAALAVHAELAGKPASDGHRTPIAVTG